MRIRKTMETVLTGIGLASTISLSGCIPSRSYVEDVRVVERSTTAWLDRTNKGIKLYRLLKEGKQDSAQVVLEKDLVRDSKAGVTAKKYIRKAIDAGLRPRELVDACEIFERL